MHLLVIRTSAMGDVALTTPVINALRKNYPDVTITLVTRSVFAPFFNSISGVHLVLPDFNCRHKGLPGIFRLFADIKNKGRIDHVIDLHDVIRTKMLRLLFRLHGIPASVIKKGRSEKKKVIKGKNRSGLKHTVERYCDVFYKAGFAVIPEPGVSIIPPSGSMNKISGLALQTDVTDIGVAPYAKHKLKMWPEEYMIRLLRMLSEKHEVKYWFFGGVEDLDKLNILHKSLPGSYVVAGKLDLGEEIALMSRLDLMITMDSSNMHMAALSGTNVISIWGGTDPVIGFGAWQQPEDYAIRIPVEELNCRPCTIYGKGKCRRGDFACMNWLTPEIVYNRIVRSGLLNKL
jgi:ADP-heptose:LPS heptosyltransferase